MKTRTPLSLLCLLTSLAFPLRAATHIWTGAVSDKFSDASNWRGGSPAGDAAAELSFPMGAARLSITNDLSGLTIRSIAISGSGYVITGLPLTLVENAEVIDTTGGPNTIACDLELRGGVTFLNRGLYDEGGLTIPGAISGVGPLVKRGEGKITFSGARANTYAGMTQVLHGILVLQKSDGISAVPGDLLIRNTGINYEYGRVGTAASEQIPDSATIHVGGPGGLGIGGVETIGPLVIESGADILTDGIPTGGAIPNGTLILAGDIRVILGNENDASLRGRVFLSGTRTITGLADLRMLRISGLREHTPGAGIIVTGTAGTDVEITGTYRGPTIIEGANVRLINESTDVRLRGGTFNGRVRSLIAEGGVVDTAFNDVRTTGDLRMTPLATFNVRHYMETPRLIAGGTLDFGGAALSFTDNLSNNRVLGAQQVIARSDGAAPIRAALAHAPEGTVLSGRYRVSYQGGDGNDLALTAVGRFPSSMELNANPSLVGNGQTATLNATVRGIGNSSPPTGSVTFREGNTVVGVAPLDSNGRASISVQPSTGTHTYTAFYDGDHLFEPSTFPALQIAVKPPTPTITSVEPSTVEAGTRVELTIRGTGFLPGGSVYLSVSGVLNTFVSPTEVRFEYTAPQTETDWPIQVSYEQPGAGSVKSNSVSFVVKGAPTPATSLTFETKAVRGPVVPGGGAAWLGAGETIRPPYTRVYYHGADLTPDTDHDGVARWEWSVDLAPGGLWLMTDMSDGKISSGRPNGRAPRPEAFPDAMFLRDEQGRYSRVMHMFQSVQDELLWVRPGLGAWYLEAEVGGELDLDGARGNGMFLFDVTQMRVVGDSPAPPPGVERGDVFLVLPYPAQKWLGGRVDEHLSESDGPGLLRFADPSATFGGRENHGVVHIPILRAGGTDGTVSVRYATADDTAVAGRSYVPRAGTLTFGPGEVVKTIDVELIDDAAYAESSVFKLVLSDPAGTTLTGKTTANIFITEDDPIPQLTSHDVTVTEGDSEENVVSVVVTLTGSARDPVTALWRCNVAGVVHEGNLTFNPGGATSQTISIRYRGNRKPEVDRVYSVVLLGAKNAQARSGAIRIIDDDFTEITIFDASISESKNEAWIYVASSTGSEKPVTVKYATVNGSAAGGSDFTGSTGTLTFGRTDGLQLVRIPILPDTVVEGDESFMIVLSDATNGRITKSSANVIIVDDDSTALPTLIASPMQAREGGQIQYRVQLSYAIAQNVTFRATTVSGTATAGVDFTERNEVITILAGHAEARFAVVTNDDFQIEEPEAFTLQLSEAVNATIATPAAPATIYDNDSFSSPNPILVSVANVEIVEGTGGTKAARFTVQLSLAPASPTTVRYATADASAIANADYAASSGTLTFASGETMKTVDVVIASDDVSEADEVFTFLAGNATATCRIVDDDAPQRRTRGTRR